MIHGLNLYAWESWLYTGEIVRYDLIDLCLSYNVFFKTTSVANMIRQNEYWMDNNRPEKYLNSYAKLVCDLEQVISSPCTYL